MRYTYTDPEVRRVVMALRSLRFLTREEIADEYNQLFPPSLSRVSKTSARVAGEVVNFLLQKKEELPNPKSPRFIHEILKFLEEEPQPLVRSEVFTFDIEPIPPTKKFTLTGAGIQFLHGNRR